MKELILKIKNNKLILMLITLIILTLLSSLLKLNYLIFPLISLCVNFFLIIILKSIFSILKLEFSKKEKIILIAFIIIIYIFYFISILNRKFIYYWDYSCYYNLQTLTQDSFLNGLLTGIKSFLGSTWSGEYGNFLSFFPEIIFSLTNKTINAYVLSCVVIYIPYIVLSFSIFIKQLLTYFKIENKSKMLIITLISFIALPLLHATFIYGQPDIFGITFIFLIISLLINYNFKKLEIPRLATLLILTFMLFISRRWYVYATLSIYTFYMVGIILTNIKNKDLKVILKNGIIYLLLALVFFTLTLFPFFINVIKGNFGYSYSYYLTGGFTGEIVSQIKHLGIVSAFIVVLGAIYGLIKKKYRLFTIFTILEYLLVILLFTRIQNMGLHHSILLIPNYLYFIFMFLTMIKNKKSVLFLYIIFIITNFIITLIPYNNILYTDIVLKTPEQKDYNEIKEVALWLKNNLNENNKAYMITHNNMYNPDKFRNALLPDKTISNYLPYGSAILGAHPFPTDLFDANLIITSSPFESVSIEESYNKVFNELVDSNKFEIIKSFDMKNGYKILIYKRLIKVDIEEANLYLKEISLKTEKYKELYEEVINNYIKSNNL